MGMVDHLLGSAGGVGGGNSVSFSIDEILTLYLAVFLAVIMMAWLVAYGRRRRLDLRSRRFLRCACCGSPIPLEEPRLRVRCPCCGASNWAELLEEISVNGNKGGIS